MDSPMMKQYMELKAQYPNEILFFRMGDFYELFLEDAEISAPIMDVALTRRQNQIPMAGVPYHSVQTYIARLLHAGKSIAIAEQEKDINNPRLMSRRVQRLITPGTILEENLLKHNKHNYLMAIHLDAKHTAFALLDVSTQDFFAYTVERPKEEENVYEIDTVPTSVIQTIRDYIYKFDAREILISNDIYTKIKKYFKEEEHLLVPLEDWKASCQEGLRQIRQIYVQDIKGLGYENEKNPALAAVSLAIHYLKKSFPSQELFHFPPRLVKPQEKYMYLDEQTIKNLDLVYNSQEQTRNRTLYSVLDECKTALGKRFLHNAILHPMLDLKQIQTRQASIHHFIEHFSLTKNFRSELNEIGDIERVLSRMEMSKAAPRDFKMIYNSILAIKQIRDTYYKEIDLETNSLVTEDIPVIIKQLDCIDALEELHEIIKSRVCDEPPAMLPANSPFIRDGVNEELDAARLAQKEGTQWILEFEKRERASLNISNLKVKYNKIYGYFIEISRSHIPKLKENYKAKQTLVNYGRFTTEELTNLEHKIVYANEIIEKIEKELFEQLCEEVLKYRVHLKKVFKVIAQFDFLLTLAHLAKMHHWTCPHIEDGNDQNTMIHIREGRHLVVEHYLPSTEQFVSNDLYLRTPDRNIGILTGPNMGGKSTFIRQVALIQLLAQMGSYVPATQAKLQVVDRIFTRIGASDNISRGESTFYVEMLETARILNQCTHKSLVVMDEIGRGTSTYDGLALAWSILEYLVNKSKPYVLFATHYHELTQLENYTGIFNLSLAVGENEEGEIIFLHKVEEKASDRSYGIQVAKLAGVPFSIIQNAKIRLNELEKHNNHRLSLLESTSVTTAPRIEPLEVAKSTDITKSRGPTKPAKNIEENKEREITQQELFSGY